LPLSTTFGWTKKRIYYIQNHFQNIGITTLMLLNRFAIALM